MIRLPLILAAGTAAAAAAVTPAIIGLTGNPSFSQQLPVHVPAHASVATFPDRPDLRLATGVDVRSTIPRESEPGDDRGRDERHADDRRRDDHRRDDHRRDDRSADQRSGRGPSATTLPTPVTSEPEPGDDHHHDGTGDHGDREHGEHGEHGADNGVEHGDHGEGHGDGGGRGGHHDRGDG